MVLSQSSKELPYQRPPVSMQREPHGPPSLHGINSYTTVIVQIVVTFSVALIVGYVLGRASFPQRQDGFLLPQGTLETIWYHNTTFSQRPAPESETAWNSLVPVGRGFVHHPEIAPFISNIAVFHQLHCLHAILVTYYADISTIEHLNGNQDADDYLQHTGTRMAPEHIRHCFDYLRQALMCAADTNLEVVSHESHLVSGWGQPRQCRDYNAVFAWAEKWANSSDTGIVT
ncbi:hypothetical protein BDV12DRAFT_210975 [Aspergillus spectabilis]